MQIAIASGKGGTGKTTVAVNLLLAVGSMVPSTRPEEIVFLDCDVEAPNAHIFLKPTLKETDQVGLRQPKVDETKCTHCGTCAKVCAFNAIAVLGQKVIVFPELCHGCGSCTYNCPEGAIHEVFYPTGKLEWGTVYVNRHPMKFGQGILNIGEAMASPVIKTLKRKGIAKANDSLTLLDAPPGNACPVVETMRGTDFVLLVTEPTPFGLHDLRTAVQVARDELHIPVGVVINRDGVGDKSVDAFCNEANIPILMRIPLERRIAEAYAEGISILEVFPEYHRRFVELYQQIHAIVHNNKGGSRA